MHFNNLDMTILDRILIGKTACNTTLLIGKTVILRYVSLLYLFYLGPIDIP